MTIICTQSKSLLGERPNKQYTNYIPEQNVEYVGRCICTGDEFPGFCNATTPFLATECLTGPVLYCHSKEWKDADPGAGLVRIAKWGQVKVEGGMVNNL